MTHSRGRIEAFMTAAALRQAIESPALIASAVPTVILDTDLRICAVNPAYEQTSLRNREALIGQEVFAAFPDNPVDPAGAGSTRLLPSLEHVLRRGKRHHMGFMRYDIPDPDNPDVYLTRVWSAVNSPVLRGSRAVGVLEQVEDVTLFVFGRAAELQHGNEPVSSLAVALAAATATLAAREQENAQLRDALARSRVIGVAVGMLMNQHNITRDQAFKLLRLRSQASNRKLRDLAEQLADTGALPPVS
jgi:hypothetical protein